MSETHKPSASEFVLPCSDLDQSIEFYSEEVGFRLCSIFPADRPRTAVLEGHGLRLRLNQVRNDAWTERVGIRITGSQSDTLFSPDGVTIEFVEESPGLVIPKPGPELIVTKEVKENTWVYGRAGMRYRDLIPGRLNGFLIASQIHVSEPGPVADYVHFHDIRFQLIFCLNGWAKLVYEDQGELFLFEQGDCVLQPPQIRHRVLETSGDFDVVEVSCPAEHETHVDNELELPNGTVDNERSFGGQRFHLSKASKAKWVVDSDNCIESRDLGLKEASDQLIEARELRFLVDQAKLWKRKEDRMAFLFVTKGKATLKHDDSGASLNKGDSIIVPAGKEAVLSKWSPEFQLLEVKIADQEAVTHNSEAEP